jgi:hypothetical protein
MAYSQETRQAVRASFVYERLDIPAIADKHNVSEATIQAWKRAAKKAGDDWSKARSASRLASGALGDITQQIMEDFALLFQTTINDIKVGEFSGLEKAEAISRLSDAYTKTMKAASAGNPKLAKLSVAFEVLSELAEFIKTHEPDSIELFARILDKFAVRVSEVFG